MSIIFLIAAVTLALSLGTGLYRVFSSDCDGDRMLASQLLGTAGIGLLLLLNSLLATPGLLDVALILALLAAVASVAFSRRYKGQMLTGEPHDD